MVTEIREAVIPIVGNGNGESVSLFHDLPSLRSWREVLRPFRIVSLWEMHKFRADLFFALANGLEKIRSGASLAETFKQHVSYEDLKESLKNEPEFLRAVIGHCDAAGLKDAQPHIMRMLDRFEGKYGGYNSARLTADYSELHWRMQDEMAKILVMRIPEDRQAYFESPRKGWEKIASRFPKALTDIEEAWKCFALDRYTASVFHSLQIIEVGLIDLGAFISVNDPISGWTAVAQRLKKILDTKYQDLNAFEKANRPFLEQLQGTVESLKNAWRNKISHVHGKLTVMTGEEFHPDVAEEILSATRAFMRRLAEGLPARKSESQEVIMPIGA